MLLHEVIVPFIKEVIEEHQISEVEPEYLNTLFCDHSHLIIDYDNLSLL